jgi:tetratricopeptide (TPR) repeat protein
VDDRRPTAKQIAELIELVRRDPSSPIALELAEAYLLLGRPYDAISALEAHLQVAHNQVDGRVLIARAYADLHQWREAQGELLRVVKVDRGSRRAFALLGEVLLRRDDFERAIPVLQHAQQLDPTSPQVLAMLRRARNGQRLDPPPQVPQPLPPRGESGNMAAMQNLSPNLGFAATMAVEPPRGKQPTTPPPPQLPPKERPRVIPQAKIVNAAAASLRQSAAVGEAYLSELMHGGLLDIAGVRVPTTELDLRPDRRWGRSTRRAFIFLTMVIVLGAAGGGTWKWWSDKQRAEAIVRGQDEARLSIVTGELAKLEDGYKSLADARDKDPSNLVTQADLAEVAALEALLYGPRGDDAAAAIKAVGNGLAAGEAGATELVLAKAALAVARLRDVAGKDGAADARTALAESGKALDDLIAKSDKDLWAQWLRARIHLAAGERAAARAQLKLAATGDDGLVVAMLDLGDMLADDGAFTDAMASYDRVVKKVAGHPLAVLGKALARGIADIDADRAIEDVNAKLALGKDTTRDQEIAQFGPRIVPYRDLAFALAYYDTDITKDAADRVQLAVAKPLAEPRFWTIVEWLQLRRGARARADAARAKIAYFGVGRPEDNALAQASAAERELALGHLDRALELAGKLAGARGNALRATALLALGRPGEAQPEIDTLVTLTRPKPDATNTDPEPSREAEMLRAEANLMLSTDPDKDGTSKAMLGIALNRTSKIGRHAAAMAFRAIGRLDDARSSFKEAVDKVDDAEAPNPVLGRSLTWYADVLIEIARGETIKDSTDAAAALGTAKDSLDKAATLDPDYVPARAIRAKLALYNGDADSASKQLEPVVRELGTQYPSIQLVWAEALATRKTAPDVDKAKEILTAIKDKVKPAVMVGRVAALIDPKLPDELGVPAPEAPKGAAPVAPPPSPRGRNGRR